MTRAISIIGYLVALLGLAYTVLAIFAGLAPGFGMSGGTRQQFLAGLALGFAVTAVGIVLVVVTRKKREL